MAYLSTNSGVGGIDGTLTSGRVPFASDSDTLTDDGGMTYDATNDLLTVTKTLTQVVVDVYNATGSAIGAGTPVYVTGSVTANKPNVAPSDADSPSTMPSAGIVTNQIGAGSSGYMAISGVINGISLSVITDGSPAAGAILYVSPTAGKLTVTKPTGTTSQIQNVGRIISINGGNFKMTVNNIGRTNDVPNEFTVPGDIEAASFTVTGGAGTDFLKGNGTLDSNTYVTAAGAITAVEGETTLDLTGAVTVAGDVAVDTNTLFVDVSANKVGIGTTTPQAPLHVAANAGAIMRLQDTVGDADAANSFVEFYDEDSRMAYIGYGSSGNANFTINNQEAGHMVFHTTNLVRMTIYATGNVNVANNLEVDGAISAGTTIQSPRLETVSVANGTTLTAANHAGRYLICSGSVTLPATSTTGEHYTILNTTGGDITVGRNANNINGAASDATVGTYNGATAIAIGSNNWIVLGV